MLTTDTSQVRHINNMHDANALSDVASAVAPTSVTAIAATMNMYLVFIESLTTDVFI
jgi:hypothetical protein